MKAPLSVDPVATLLLGKGRRALLALLFSRPDDTFYLREAARLTGASSGTTMRELRALESVGLVTSRARGNQRHYQASKASPVFPALRTLLEQTMGAPDLIRAALAPFAGQIAFAGIFGSLARGALRAGSDVDVLVIGDLEFSQLTDLLVFAEQRLSRAVNPTAYSPARFTELLREGQPFLMRVLAGPIVPVLGDLPGDAVSVARERMAAGGSRQRGRGRPAARHR